MLAGTQYAKQYIWYENYANVAKNTVYPESISDL